MKMNFYVSTKCCPTTRRTRSGKPKLRYLHDEDSCRGKCIILAKYAKKFVLQGQGNPKMKTAGTFLILRCGMLT
jgi:hypothetical protein